MSEEQIKKAAEIAYEEIDRRGLTPPVRSPAAIQGAIRRAIREALSKQDDEQ